MTEQERMEKLDQALEELLCDWVRSHRNDQKSFRNISVLEFQKWSFERTRSGQEPILTDGSKLTGKKLSDPVEFLPVS